MFSETYRPKRISDVTGQPTAVKEFLAWYNTWPEQGKACLLSGKPGTGKTSLVGAVASELKLDLIELNTSDKRNEETIERIAGNAASSQTLSGARKLILLDEVDNMSGRDDFGGTRAISRIISETQNPIVLIANDTYEVPESIRRACTLIQFHGIHESTIEKKLSEIAEKEKLALEPELIERIAKNAGGDLRAALNDLESQTEGMRDPRPTMFQALSELFRMKSADVRREFFNLDEQPENIMLWVAENLPYVYEKKDIAEAYERLSRADIFLGRVSRRQYYSLWGYASDLMTGGVSVAREGKFTFHRFSFPGFIYQMGRTKKKRELVKRMTAKIGGKCHCSSYAAKTYLPLLQALDTKPEKLASLALYFGLDEEEISLISGKPDAIVKLMKQEKRGEGTGGKEMGDEEEGSKEKEGRKKNLKKERKKEPTGKGKGEEESGEKRKAEDEEAITSRKQRTLFDYK